jgi:hypothetical protein
MSDYIRQHATVTTQFTIENSWVVLSSIEQNIKLKMEELGVPLKDWDVSIYRGILTGYNEAFIIDSETRDKLIDSSAKNAEIIRPILRGRDIKKYGVTFDNLWLINSHNGLKAKNVPKIDVRKEYPTIFNHLMNYEKELKKRQDKGDHWTNLRNCVYFEEFDHPKILYPETMRVHKNDLNNFPRFAYDESGYYCDKTIFFISGNNLKYLLGFLNSKIFRFLLPKYVTAWDDSGFMIQKIFLEKIPAIFPNIEIKNEIQKIVENIIINKDNSTLIQLISKIDNIFYNLLQLSDEEKKTVELFSFTA